MWTVNFQMFKLVLEKAEEPEIKLPTSTGSLKKQECSSPITSWHIDRATVETVSDFILGAPESLQMVTPAMKLKDTCSLEEKLWPT